MALKNMDGICMGQCTQWAIQLIKEGMQSLMQPSFHKGNNLQSLYDRVWEKRWFFQNGDIFFWEKLKKDISSKTIAVEIAKKSRSVVALVNSLPSFKGNAAIVIAVRCQDTPSCFNAFGITASHSGHAVALMRTKHDGAIHFYDPNYGVFRWVPESGLPLALEIDRWMLSHNYGVRFLLEGAMMLSTDEHIAANYVHVAI